MAITVTCNNCLSEYNIRETNAGKKFACKQCGEMCSVPRLNKSRQRSQPSSRNRGPEPRRKKRPQYEDDYEEYDDYEADGYDEYDDYEDDDYDYAPRRSKPVRKTRKSSKKKKPRHSSSGLIESGDNIFETYTSNAVLWVGIPFAIALLIAVFSLVVGPASMFAMMIVVIVGCVVSAASGLHSLILAFREDVACGLMIMFVPFYNLYYLVTRWEEQRGPFLMQLSMILMIVSSLFAVAVGAGE